MSIGILPLNLNGVVKQIAFVVIIWNMFPDLTCSTGYLNEGQSIIAWPIGQCNQHTLKTSDLIFFVRRSLPLCVCLHDCPIFHTSFLFLGCALDIDYFLWKVYCKVCLTTVFRLYGLCSSRWGTKMIMNDDNVFILKRGVAYLRYYYYYYYYYLWI